MDTLPAWVAKIGLVWVAIGTFLIQLAQFGVGVPDFLSTLFSPETWSAIVTAIGSILAAAAIFKTILAAAKKKDNTEITILSASVKIKHLNPFNFNV